MEEMREQKRPQRREATRAATQRRAADGAPKHPAGYQEKRPHIVDVAILAAGELVFGIIGVPIYIFLVLPKYPEGALPGIVPLLAPRANPIIAVLAVVAVIAVSIGAIALLSRTFGAAQFKVDAVDELLRTYSTADLVVIYIAAGIAEEFLFRVALMSLFGLIVSSLLFTAVHAAYWKKPLMLVYVFIVGLALGLLFSYTGSWLLCAIAHAAYNLVVSVLMQKGILPLDKK